MSARRNREDFKRRVRAWAVRLQVAPAQIRVQKMSRKWASCSPGKWVTFSDDLLSQSRGFQDYAVVHELLHLRVPNHGKLFKSLMSVYLPGWERLANDFDCSFQKGPIPFERLGPTGKNGAASVSSSAYASG